MYGDACVFYDVAPCSMAFWHDDGGSKLPWNVGQLLPDYTADVRIFVMKLKYTHVDTILYENQSNAKRERDLDTNGGDRRTIFNILVVDYQSQNEMNINVSDFSY